jgi:hypothetical protein
MEKATRDARGLAGRLPGVAEVAERLPVAMEDESTVQAS